MNAAVTTSLKLKQDEQQMAMQFAHFHAMDFLPRNGKSLKNYFERYDIVYIYTSTGIEAVKPTGERYKYHPGTAMFRYKRWIAGEQEPLLRALNLVKGDSFLDCTIGFGADALMASVDLGDSGIIVGLEKSEVLAFLMKVSQQFTNFESEELQQAFRRIEIVQQDAVDYLRNQPDNSFDVVYMDPLFETAIEESTNFTTHKQFAVRDQLTDEWVREAIRVCRKRAVIKAHYTSELFEEYGFHQLKRKSAKFHFGVRNKKDLCE